MVSFSELLVAYETRGTRFSETKILAAFLICDKLRPQLTVFMGNTGVRALLARALVLANVDIPVLRAVHIKSDGSFEGLEELAAQVDPDKISKAGVVLLAQLLGLLVAFIGEILTLQLVHAIWPQLPANNLHFGSGDKNEKVK